MAVLNRELQQQCKQLILKYKSYKREGWKVRCRNQLYLLMKPWLLRWVKDILGKWGKCESEGGLLRLSWECFYFCLERYKVGSSISLPKYFYNFSRYYLLGLYARREVVTLPLEELKEVLHLVPENPPNALLENILTLRQFQEQLPEEYVPVFEDALMSLAPAPKQRVWHWRKGMGVTRQTYCELKKAYKNVILWILTG